MKDLGLLHYFLGVKVVQNSSTGEIWIGQPAYTEKLYADGIRLIILAVWFSDADWGGSIDDRKSTSGYV